MDVILRNLQFVYLALAIIGGVIYYFIYKKLVFDKHPHSKTLITAMTFNMVLNIIVTFVFALLMFDKDGRVCHFFLRTYDIKNKAMLILQLAVFIVEIATLVVGTRTVVKRKGHKNLKLERILVSDYTVTAVCSALCLVGLLLVIFFFG